MTYNIILADGLKWKSKCFIKKFLGILVGDSLVVMEIQFHDFVNSNTFYGQNRR